MMTRMLAPWLLLLACLQGCNDDGTIWYRDYPIDHQVTSHSNHWTVYEGFYQTRCDSMPEAELYIDYRVEGMSQHDALRRLGWPESSIKKRK